MKSTDKKDTSANALILESSPYLLQHAYNPVKWEAWSPAVIERARLENKVILVSIGYSACHWCHVMEHECFEDEEVAALQNEYFVNIKVDREERPDVDQVYMDAIQAMGMRGGWPLNVFLLPDGKPFYGGTYFPKPNWINVLKGVHRAFTEEFDKVIESAEQLTDALQRSEIEKYRIGKGFSSSGRETAHQAFNLLHEKHDSIYGGMSGAPKFPMPCIYEVVLRYWHFTNDSRAKNMLQKSLDKIALGGIYDQVGGGFARYSVDDRWFIPHFEKMLYDNGQLLHIYASAYRKEPKTLYERIIRQTINWLVREMKSPEGGFYAALDADSEGEEGRFYCFTMAELQESWGNTHELLSRYYQCTDEGNWEEGKNVLFPSDAPEVFAQKEKLSIEEFHKILDHSSENLLEHRATRIRPGLDDKILCGWNALTISGLCESYKSLGNAEYLELAEETERYIDKNLFSSDGNLYRCLRKHLSPIPAFLEDYAALFQAYVDLYEVTFNEDFLQKAVHLMTTLERDFFNPDEGYFHFSGKDHGLIANKIELFDNVIPSPNSIIATTLNRLGRIIGNTSMTGLADQMLEGVAHLLETEPRYLANWAALLSNISWTEGDLVIALPEKEENNFKKELFNVYSPGLTTAKSGANSVFTILKDKRPINNKVTYYLCEKGACQKPVHDFDEVWVQINHRMN